MKARNGVHILDSLATLAAPEWDALAEGHPLLSHAFLHALHETGCAGANAGWAPCYLTLWRNGALEGAMPLYLKSHSYGEYVFDWAWADAYQRHGLDYYPKLLCAVPFTPVRGRRLLAAGEPERVHRILLASAGIPAVFPAREIGPHLFVDGAITGNILYGARVDQEHGVAAQWRAKHGRAPAPRVRYWVIFNNQFRFPPQVTQERWADIMSRATIMATQNATVSAMRHLEASAELIRLKYGIDVEVRVMAVPDTWVPKEAGTFKKEVMNDLADLGEKMGADPASWSIGVPD